MSNLAEHEAEQAAITALCESGQCQHPECKPTVARVAYETLQFFEIDLPEGADPESFCDTFEAREHFADLIKSGFIEFTLERQFDEGGNEV